MFTRVIACSESRRHVTRLLAPTLAIVAAVLATERAGACGASPTPSYAIAGVSPTSGATGVVRDVGIIISGAPSFTSNVGPTPFAEVELIDIESDAVVPVREISWLSFDGAQATMAIHPVEPLLPLHAYRVEATPITLEAESLESPVYISSFTTSEALLEPIVLSGGIELSLRAGQADVFGDCSRCGGACDVVGQRPALLADVRLPAPSGGQGVYRGILHFSDHTPIRVSGPDVTDYERSLGDPHEIHLTQSLALEAGQTLSLTQEVIEEPFAYAGCFTFVVWDPAGHREQTTACLPSLAPEDIRALRELDAPLELDADEDEAAAQVQDAAWGGQGKPTRVLGGCALGATTERGAPAVIALLTALVLLRRRP
jgi:hypothetical protein